MFGSILSVPILIFIFRGVYNEIEDFMVLFDASIMAISYGNLVCSGLTNILIGRLFLLRVKVGDIAWSGADYNDAMFEFIKKVTQVAIYLGITKVP